jgi:hypothetical protein
MGELRDMGIPAQVGIFATRNQIVKTLSNLVFPLMINLTTTKG